MAWHEILKYSPKNYKNRIYTVDEWTSRCEVGKYFNGKQFTIEEYLRVEQHHINVILSIMKAVQSRFVVIRYLEADKADIIESIQDSKFHDIDSPLLQSIPLLEVKKRIHPNEIPDIVRLALREYIYVELGNKEIQNSIWVRLLSLCCMHSSKRRAPKYRCQRRIVFRPKITIKQTRPSELNFTAQRCPTSERLAI